MKERPILMSAPMVRACLDGSKTQTRRAIKVQPPEKTREVLTWHHPKDQDRPYFFAWVDAHNQVEIAEGWCTPCPYGQPGDRLWVRETWREDSPDDPEGALYRATDTRTMPPGFKWKPSIFMPRWACRLELEITGVRVERLQDISEVDAKAEGCESIEVPECCGRPDVGAVYMGDVEQICCGNPEPADSYKAGYRELWEAINGRGAWEANPWVWVIEFKRVKP